MPRESWKEELEAAVEEQEVASCSKQNVKRFLQEYANDGLGQKVKYAILNLADCKHGSPKMVDYHNLYNSPSHKRDDLVLMGKLLLTYMLARENRLRTRSA